MAGCWFIYCRVSRAKAPSWDGKSIYTAGREGARDQVLCSSLPRMRREWRSPGSCRLRLGVQMETSYSRVSPASYSGLLKSDSTVMGL